MEKPGGGAGMRSSIDEKYRIDLNKLNEKKRAVGNDYGVALKIR